MSIKYTPSFYYGNSDQLPSDIFGSSLLSYMMQQILDEFGNDIEELIVNEIDDALADFTIESVGIDSADQSVTCTYDSENNSYDLAVAESIRNEIRNKQNINIGAGLIMSGIRCQYFCVNYHLQSNGTTVSNYTAAGNSYVPICDIVTTNIGKSQVCFEVISREDTFGYTAKYFFASKWLGSTSPDPNFVFMGCNYMNSPRTELYFDQDSLVVVPFAQGTTSYYRIYKKNHVNGAYDFFLINVLFEDVPTYATIKWYTNVQTASFNNVNNIPLNTGAAVAPVTEDNVTTANDTWMGYTKDILTEGVKATFTS
jgi:hypothetical protein